MALRFGRVVVDPATGDIRCDDEPVTLRDKERDLLLYLAKARGRVVSRDELLFEVWGYRRGVASRTVDTTVRRLRARLDLAGLQTVRGEGYRLVPPAEPAGQLPARPSLQGRAELVEAALDHLLRGRTVALVGPRGIGTTTVAAEVAHRLVDRGLAVTWWTGSAPAPEEVFPLSVAGALLLTQGPIEAGIAVLEEALVWTGPAPHARADIHGQLASANAALGDIRAARLHLEQAAPARALGLGFRASYQIALGLLAAVEGRDDDAMQALLSAEDQLRRSGRPAVAGTRRLRAVLEGDPARFPPVENAVVERVVSIVNARHTR